MTAGSSLVWCAAAAKSDEDMLSGLPLERLATPRLGDASSVFRGRLPFLLFSVSCCFCLQSWEKGSVSWCVLSRPIDSIIPCSIDVMFGSLPTLHCATRIRQNSPQDDDLG